MLQLNIENQLNFSTAEVKAKKKLRIPQLKSRWEGTQEAWWQHR